MEKTKHTIYQDPSSVLEADKAPPPQKKKKIHIYIVFV